MKREPDCAFDVWSDSLITEAVRATAQQTLDAKWEIKQRNRGHWITHRIRVFLKDRKQ